MKSTLVKILAAAMVFAFIFAFSSCKKDSETETTTAAQTTAENTATAENTTMPEETATQSETLPGETTAAVTTLPGETTAAATTLPGQTTAASTAAATTKPAAGITAPVGGSMSQIISFYNQYANAMKTYKGKVTVTKSDGTVSTIKSITGGSVVKGIALDLLPNDYTEKPTYTFINGTSTKDNKNLSKWLPRDQSAKMSEINPSDSGVKSASCVKSGSGWKINIVMKDDKTSGTNALNDKPKYVSRCMDTLDLTNEDLKPFTLENAVVNYTGCKIDAVFDAQGRLTKLDITTPANITGKLKYGIIGINADVTGNYRGNYTFAY